MLLAFDLDKTIVTNDYKLPKRIQDTIQAAREAGHLVTILTGRTRASALPYLEQLEHSGPYSVNHGALVVDANGEPLRKATIDRQHALELITAYQDWPELEYSCIAGDTLYVRKPLDERWNWAHTLDQQIVQFEHYHEDYADKVVFYCPVEGLRIHQEISESHPELVLYLWEDNFLEVTGANGHKGAALELIAQTLGVPREETVAFGDGVNDVTMIQWAGRGIAVGPHVFPEVLAAADEHIASPEEGGVADWLERNVLAVKR